MSPETRACQVCWSEFTPARSNNIYCSTRCKNTASRRRNQRPADDHTEAAHTHAHDPQPAATRSCPHCGEPVTIVALLTTPEAARPTVPDSTIVPLHRRSC